MAQLSPFLKPPKGAGLRPVESDKDGDGPRRNALNLPVAPAAGFLRRFGALLFDLVLVFFVVRALGIIFGDGLIDVSPAAHYVATAGFFLYFILGNSAVGKGRTVGKLLVGIRTVRFDGAPPTVAQSAARTFLLFPGIFVGVFLAPVVFDLNVYNQWLLSFLFSSYLTFALFVGNFFSIGFNPFKQGYHDHLCKTLVVPAAAEDSGLERIKEAIGPGWPRYYRQTQFNGGLSFLLIFILLAFLTHQAMSSDDPAAENFNRSNALAAELLGPGVQISAPVIPPEETMLREMEVSFERRREFLDSLYDADSTDPIKVSLILTRRGRWTAAPEELDEQGAELARRFREEIFGALPPDAIVSPTREGISAANLDRRPLRIEVIFREEAQLFFPFHVARHVARDLELLFDPLRPNGEVEADAAPPTAPFEPEDENPAEPGGQGEE